ncbi:MAG: hypothetical protein GY820_17875, partial [Gammaproteobacteria bacterium]|nr:hypothetical protein [Gammaproteobacteria bacterium]
MMDKNNRERELVSFDWAVKRLLRSKANFGVLEGFLSELLKKPITISAILESESNQDHIDDKYNRVDLIAEDKDDKKFIIELQFNYQVDYIQRTIYGATKAIQEHMKISDPYWKIPRVYSISILHFDVAKGNDYIYHG